MIAYITAVGPPTRAESVRSNLRFFCIIFLTIWATVVVGELLCEISVKSPTRAESADIRVSFDVFVNLGLFCEHELGSFNESKVVKAYVAVVVPSTRAESAMFWELGATL